ncbi:eIF4e-like protein [Coleophoma cylindrospora]|uniref:eIF4e-like protein n=1 Tax=Coleophoma cylindrospora TaxID=1849047 RepID=A0A3D8RBR7_9HELO|nr:eIF4e-like protein [Coleophoma cylindrospora]
MDNLWTRRSKYAPLGPLQLRKADRNLNSSSKLSLSTAPSTNGAPFPNNNDHPTRNYNLSRRHGDSSSHSNKNPFNAMSPSAGISSPTAGASSAFGLGSGAFASFGASSKTPKAAGNVLDFGSVVGSTAKTPTTEKSLKDASITKGPITRTSTSSLTESKTATPPPAHALRHDWVFWFRPPINKSNGFVDYEKTLHPMAHCSTVEEFFTVYRHLKRPSTLPLVSDYHLFKKGIRPVWEDDENRKGGKWIVRLKKGVADRFWEDLLLAIIGDQFGDASEEVCGVVISVRSGEDILSIWTRNDGGKVLQIRNTMKRVLNFPPEIKMEFKSHDSSIQQRTALDDARKEKTNQHNRNGNNSRDEKPAPTAEAKQTS